MPDENDTAPAAATHPPADSVHARAALGDGAAFRQLAEAHCESALQGDEPAIIALTSAVVYARLAMISRGTREDRIAFIRLLDMQAEALRAAGLEERADYSHAELIALCESMAEEGDEEFAQIIVNHAAELSVGSMNIARQLQGIVKGILK